MSDAFLFVLTLLRKNEATSYAVCESNALQSEP
jgi:hypothetical protein